MNIVATAAVQTRTFKLSKKPNKRRTRNGGLERSSGANAGSGKSRSENSEGAHCEVTVREGLGCGDVVMVVTRKKRKKGEEKEANRQNFSLGAPERPAVLFL